MNYARFTAENIFRLRVRVSCCRYQNAQITHSSIINCTKTRRCERKGNLKLFVPSHLTRWWLKALLFYPFFRERAQIFCDFWRIFNFFKEAFHVIQRSARVGGHSWKKPTNLWLSDIETVKKTRWRWGQHFQMGARHTSIKKKKNCRCRFLPKLISYNDWTKK